jgi:hypothetical protein
MARLDRKLEVAWLQLKILAAKKFVGFHSYETSNATEVYIIEDGKPSFWAAVFKDNDPRYVEADRNDWVNNHEGGANGPTKPRDYDGKDKVQPVTLSKNQWHYWHSVGDTAGALRNGQQFQLSRSADGDASCTWQYRDPVWMAGGELMFQGAAMGDHVSFCVFAPATPVTAADGGNTGNCNVYYGVIVPAAGDGAYNVDLDEAHPVPAPSEDGYWDYALPANMQFSGTVTVSSAPGSAKYHLIAQRFDLTRFVTKELLLGAGKTSYEPQNINASLCLPQWRFECVIHNEGGSHQLDVVWRVLVSRYWTTV